MRPLCPHSIQLQVLACTNNFSLQESKFSNLFKLSDLLHGYHLIRSGCWTLNFDGLFYYNSGLAGLGGIVRDDKGCLILAFAAIITAKQPLFFFFFFLSCNWTNEKRKKKTKIDQTTFGGRITSVVFRGSVNFLSSSIPIRNYFRRGCFKYCYSFAW